jgi:carboxymethylenebutenolidase
MIAPLLVVAAMSNGPAPPPPAHEAREALEASPRQSEWVDLDLPGDFASIRTFIVYPEREDPAPVVLVIHDIHGLGDWTRAAADRLAAAGFIAVAPDFLSGLGPGGGGSEAFADPAATASAIRELSPERVTTGLNAVRSHASSLGTAAGPVATVGFGWGGDRSFDYATRQPALAAAVVYYGASPSDPGALARVESPVLGLYGGDDRRVNATIEAARDELERHRKDFETHVYDGAGHGFLRQVDGRDGANRKAAEKSWPVMLRFLRKHLEWIDR